MAFAVLLRLSEQVSDVCEKNPELIWVKSGTVILSIDGENCLLEANEGLFCPMGCHRSMQPQGLCDLIQIALPMEIGALSRRIYPIDPFYPTTLVKEATQQQPEFETMTDHLLDQILILCRRHGGAALEEQSVSAHPLLQHAWIVHQVRDYLHSHFDQRITLELLANLHDISVTQLKRIFKAQTGTTIITYLTQHRMEQAKRLIREGTLNFTQIAEAVGYENIYYFSTQFKKQTGMTPTEYSKTTK